MANLKLFSVYVSSMASLLSNSPAVAHSSSSMRVWQQLNGFSVRSARRLSFSHEHVLVTWAPAQYSKDHPGCTIKQSRICQRAPAHTDRHGTAASNLLIANLPRLSPTGLSALRSTVLPIHPYFPLCLLRMHVGVVARRLGTTGLPKIVQPYQTAASSQM